MGNIPLGRFMCRWEGNICKHLKEVGVSMRTSTDLGQNCEYWRNIVNVTLNIPAYISYGIRYLTECFKLFN